MRSSVLAVAVSLALGSPAVAQDKAEAILKDMRQALGGDKLAAAKSVTLEAAFAREMGPSRRVGGIMVLSIALPDKMHRSEAMTLPGSNMFERITATNGTAAWEEIKQRGSGVGLGGPPSVGDGLSPEAIDEARLRRTRTELARYLAAFFGSANLQATWLSTAQAGPNKADVLELKTAPDGTTKLFVDQANHMPMMMQYVEERPAGGGGRGGRGGAPGAGGGAPAAGGMPPAAPSQVTLLLADYKEVDGVKLPHRIVHLVDGRSLEEWTLKKIKFNPPLKADLFDKK